MHDRHIEIGVFSQEVTSTTKVMCVFFLTGLVLLSDLTSEGSYQLLPCTVPT
jgi:hypothetical protein